MMVKEKLYQSIMETGASYLVKDFRVFMDELFNAGGYLTKKSQQIAPKFLHDLNQKMTYPTEHVTPRNQQPIYHELHLFQHLAKAARLYERTRGKNGNFNIIPNERYQQFCNLTATEQYFTLLETFWIVVDLEKLLEYSKSFFILVEHLPTIFEILGKQEVGINLHINTNKSNEDLDKVVSSLGNFVAYLAYFGFWQVERYHDLDKTTNSKKHFKASSITITEFGQQMMNILVVHRPLDEWNELYLQHFNPQQTIGDFKEMMDDLLQEMLNNNFDKSKMRNQLEDIVQAKSVELEHGESFVQPFKALFSDKELQKTLSKPVIERKSGVYTFKISLSPGIWRRVAMQDTATLDDLHRAIQKHFCFDDDHLYAFYMDGNKFSDDCYNSPISGDEPNAEKAEVGDLDLIEGQDFLYLFDFGDEWTFNIKLEKINSQTDTNVLEEVQLIDGKGEAPEQYSWW